MPYCSTFSLPPSKKLEAKMVHAVTLDVLVHTVTLDIAGEEYTPLDVLNVVLVAAAKGATIQQAARELKTVPHPNTVRYHSDKFDINLLETELNDGLIEPLPKRMSCCFDQNFPSGSSPTPYPPPRGGTELRWAYGVKATKRMRQGKGKWNIAIDITLVPYYGKNDPASDFIIRSLAQAGTTRFFGAISAYVGHQNTRYTLLVYSIRRSQSVVAALKRVLFRLKEINIRLKRLYLDRGFYSVAVLQFLHREAMPYVMPVVKRGRSGGLRQLMTGGKSYRTTYTITSSANGVPQQVMTDVLLLRRYAKGKYGQHGVQWFGYAVHRYPGTRHGVYQDYRRRFGIESSYRLMNSCRARTASKAPACRFLLVAIALLLQNLWVYRTFVSHKRKGGRQVLSPLFPFSKLLAFLLQTIYQQYGQVRSIEIPEFSL